MHGRPVLRLYLTRCCVCSTQFLRLLLQLLMVFFTVPPPPHHAATVREHDVYHSITTHAGLVLATRVPVPCSRLPLGTPVCAHNEMAPCQAEARALRDQYDAKDREVKATKTQVMYACARGSLVIHLLCIHDHSTAHAVAHATIGTRQ